MSLKNNRIALLVFVLVLMLSANFLAAQERAEAKFSIHEWGVFTVPRGADWLNQDMLAEWQSFPEFFQGTLPDRKLLYRGPVTKPVIFIHSEDETEKKLPIDLYIRFTDGQPLIWWPPVEHPADSNWANTTPTDWKDVHPKSFLRYYMMLNQTGRTEAVEDGHWVNHLRDVSATSFTVTDSYGKQSLGGEIKESFIYYDGLMKPPAVPIVERTATGVTIKAESDHEWLDVLILERDFETSALSIARVEKIERGSPTTEVTLAECTNNDRTKLPEHFRKSLTDAGLNEDEAQSLINVWSNGLFEQSGMTLIYRIPQATYDEWIPLNFKPKPTSTVRVGLVMHRHLEPELGETVARLVKKLESDIYKERLRADRQLRSIGGAAFETLRKIAEGSDPESAARATKIIQELDTAELLEKVMTRYQTNSDE